MAVRLDDPREAADAVLSVTIGNVVEQSAGNTGSAAGRRLLVEVTRAVAGGYDQLALGSQRPTRPPVVVTFPPAPRRAPELSSIMARLGAAVRDLLTVVAAAAADEPRRARSDNHDELRRRIDTFIDAHLGDPDLTPGTIAEAHHISLRYLHKRFGRAGHGVAGLIRRRRLERIRRDLLDPAQADRPVYAIAARWGFTSAAHFSRSFRDVYGLPPAKFRATLAPHTASVNSEHAD